MIKTIEDLNHMELSMCNNMLISVEQYGHENWQEYAYKRLEKLGITCANVLFARILRDELMPLEHRMSIAALFWFHIEEMIAFYGRVPEEWSKDCYNETMEISRLDMVEIFMDNRIITLLAKWYITAPWYHYNMIYTGTNVINGAPIHQMRLRDLLHELRGVNVKTIKQVPLNCTNVRVHTKETADAPSSHFDINICD